MKIEVNSQSLNKGIDAAKSFLGKILKPSLEETGLLIQDKVRMWRFQQQVKMLNRAQEYCEKHQISTKAISAKLLCPLLEYASLEEDEKLIDHWAILMGNLIDSETNVESHVFPYILSQISSREFQEINGVYLPFADMKQKQIDQFREDLSNRDENIISMNERLDKLEIEINHIPDGTREKGEKIVERLEVIRNIKNLEVIEIRHRSNLKQRLEIKKINLEEYELANLIRLGIIEIETHAFTTKNHFDIDEELRGFVDIEVDQVRIKKLTELGELFLRMCNEKNK